MLAISITTTIPEQTAWILDINLNSSTTLLSLQWMYLFLNMHCKSKYYRMHSISLFGVSDSERKTTGRNWIERNIVWKCVTKWANNSLFDLGQIVFMQCNWIRYKWKNFNNITRVLFIILAFSSLWNLWDPNCIKASNHRLPYLIRSRKFHLGTSGLEFNVVMKTVRVHCRYTYIHLWLPAKMQETTHARTLIPFCMVVERPPGRFCYRPQI